MRTVRVSSSLLLLALMASGCTEGPTPPDQVAEKIPGPDADKWAMLGEVARGPEASLLAPLTYHTPDIPVTGFGVGEGVAGTTAFRNINNSATWEYYTLFGTAGDLVIIEVHRTTNEMDPAISLFFGTTPDNTGVSVFEGVPNMIFLAFADDNFGIPHGVGGLFADPRMVITLPFTGLYTLAVYDFIGQGPSPKFEIHFSGLLADTDGDGTFDIFDNCPNVFGPPDNGGCPRPEVPAGTPIPNGPSSCEIEVDGRFGSSGCIEWGDITPVVSLRGASIVYQALDEVDGEFLYLMYDWIGSQTPLQPGEASGQVRFFVGSDVFDVTFVQGGLNSTGGLNDDVNVLRNGLPFDNSLGAIVGAVDNNSTSPNFAQPHNLFELKVRLLDTEETPGGLPSPDGLYDPAPAFWGARLPGSPLVDVSSIILDIGLGGVVTATTEVSVEIDIKPGSDRNPINTKSKGKIPVAILSSPDLDAPVKVVRESLTFGATGAEQSLGFCTGAEDVNGDGLLDLVCHFETQQTGFQSGDEEGILRGQNVYGVPIVGRDAVQIVK